MPRRLRVNSGGFVYHVLNRASGKKLLFAREGDYLAFEKILLQAHQRMPMRTLAYCLMPTHWHLVLWPERDGQLSEFLRWVSVTHAQRHHAHRHSAGTGPLYQGRFKSFPVQDDRHCLIVCRYVERNPVRAGRVARSQNWKWSSAAPRKPQERPWLLPADAWPVHRPSDWRQWVNEPQTPAEEARLVEAIRRGRPYGDEKWTAQTARRLQLQSTLNPRGRPGKAKTDNPQGKTAGGK